MVAALWVGPSWWFIVPAVGDVILVPFGFVLVGDY
jgi:hypothetical protein